MALNDEAVRSGDVGDVYVAPVGSTLPDDVTTALDAAFEQTGLISTDGMTETYKVTKNVIKAWQRKAGVRTLTPETEWTFKFVALESSPLIHELFYGGDTTVTAGVARSAVANNPVGTERAFVFEFVDGDVVDRFVIPKGDITDRGDLKRSADDATMYELTITVLGTTADDLGYKLSNDPNYVNNPTPT